MIWCLLLSIAVSRGSGSCGTYEGFVSDSLNTRLQFSSRFPWLVSVQDLNKSHLIVGTIISNSWIVTAPSGLMVRRNLVAAVGIAHPGPPHTEEEELYAVRKVIVHPDFDADSLVNDLMLLMTEQKIMFGQWVQPVCVPSQDPRNSALTACQVSDWKGPAALEGAPLPPETGNSAADAWNKLPVENVHSCPLQRVRSTECCGYHGQERPPGHEGKKGNPVSCKVKSSEQWVLAGILTGGGSESYGPFLYTRISHYSEWITGCSVEEGEPFVPSIILYKPVINGVRGLPSFTAAAQNPGNRSEKEKEQYSYYDYYNNPSPSRGHRSPPACTLGSCAALCAALLLPNMCLHGRMSPGHLLHSLRK